MIVNSDLDVADRYIDAVLIAQRLERQRRTGLTGFVRGLLKDLWPRR